MMCKAGAQLRGNTLVVRSEAPLVGHTQWLAKAISEAKRGGHGLALVTPETTRITRSLARLMFVLGFMWVVDDGTGDPYLGLLGRRVEEIDGEYFGADEFVPRYSRPDSIDDRGGVLVRAEVLRPRRFRPKVGHLTEAVTRSISGGLPLGWGVQEPVTQPWSVKDISSTYSKEAAAGHFLHFVGPMPQGSEAPQERLAGTLEIQKPRNGVVEYVEAACVQPGPWDAERKAGFARAMHEQSVRWATAFHTVGGDPTIVPPFWLGQPVPVVAVFGREALKGHDVDQVVSVAKSQGAEHCEVFGEKSAVTLAVMLPSEPREGMSHPVEILETVQRRLTGGAGSLRD